MIIGMDPGVSGAIAILSGSGDIAEIHDMPVFAITKKTSGKDRTKRHINVHALSVILSAASGARAVIEYVSARPNDGTMQAFQLGFAAGALHGAAGAAGLRIETVTPAVWKKHFKLSADKSEARQYATRRWPEHADQFKRVADAGRAEAALIALYAIEKGQ